MIRTVVAIESENLSDAVCLALERDGIPVRFRCQTGAEALRALKKMGGGVAVCSFRLPDMLVERPTVQASEVNLHEERGFQREPDERR